MYEMKGNLELPRSPIKAMISFENLVYLKYRAKTLIYCYRIESFFSPISVENAHSAKLRSAPRKKINIITCFWFEADEISFA